MTLICKPHLVSFYQRHGFNVRKKQIMSDDDKTEWFLMSKSPTADVAGHNTRKQRGSLNENRSPACRKAHAGRQLMVLCNQQLSSQLMRAPKLLVAVADEMPRSADLEPIYVDCKPVPPASDLQGPNMPLNESLMEYGPPPVEGRRCSMRLMGH